MGTKRRVSGINTYISKAYDAANGEVEGVEKIDDIEFNTPEKWDSGLYWTILNGKAICVNTGASEYPLYPKPSITSIISKQYIVTLDIIANTGFIKFYAGSTAVVTFTGTGVKTATIIGSSGALFIVCQAGKSCEIESISVKEIQANDAVQATELSQPWLSGNIAPNERLALKNPNGRSRLLTHPAISFAANEAWSASIIINGNYSQYFNLFGSYETGSCLRLADVSVMRITGNFDSNVGMVFTNDATNKFFGKNAILTATYDNNGIKVYINGVLFATSISTGIFTFSMIMSGRSNLSATGKVHTHRIQSGALTPEQVSAEYNFLRARFPEMESVVIGSQEWTTSNFEAVATPQGNVIQEMQANAAVEKITGGDFESGLVGVLTSGDEISTWTLNTVNPLSGTQDGRLQVTTVGTNTIRPLLRFTVSVAANKYSKITFNYRVNSGTCIISTTEGGGPAATLTGTGTFTRYTKHNSGISSFIVFFNGTNLFDLQIDNVSVQELGWANSTEIYDAVYAATAGTNEQKTYAAVKEAAMWCHYNNSPDLGAIYGKLYNWYAAKLLQMDIDYYNAANPTTPWGWRVPTKSSVDILRDFLGGENIAGGKLKSNTLHWTQPNIGADNLIGFTALGNGGRNEIGIFGQILGSFTLWEADDQDSITGYGHEVRFNEELLRTGYSFNRDKRNGKGIRLIKTT